MTLPKATLAQLTPAVSAGYIGQDVLFSRRIGCLATEFTGDGGHCLL